MKNPFKVNNKGTIVEFEHVNATWVIRVIHVSDSELATASTDIVLDSLLLSLNSFSML